MKVIKEKCWLAPKGEFTGTITSVKLNKEDKYVKRREHVRLVIAVDPIPNDPMFEYHVGIDYGAPQANKLISGGANFIL